MDAFERGETVKFDIDGAEVELSRDDCLISPAQKPGFVAESDGGMTVVIDTNLTPELIEKGYVREVISKLQTMRKEAGFGVVDRISVSYRDHREAGGRAGEERRGGLRQRAGHVHDRGRAGGRLRQGMEHQRRKGHADRSEELRQHRPIRRCVRLCLFRHLRHADSSIYLQ